MLTDISIKKLTTFYGVLRRGLFVVENTACITKIGKIRKLIGKQAVVKFYSIEINDSQQFFFIRIEGSEERVNADALIPIDVHLINVEGNDLAFVVNKDVECGVLVPAIPT